MLAFQTLGDRIEEAFSAKNYDERAFPDIAARALEEASLPSRITHQDVVRWVLSSRALPTQDDLSATFGQPPVTVYRGRRFFIQVLLWLEGSTAIHRHSFSGAFSLLTGESLHTRYAFELERRVSARFLIGNVRLIDASLLGRGDVVPITHDLAHALFHLDTPSQSTKDGKHLASASPSATIVVRTFREQDTFPQYDYLPPRVACDTFHEDPTTVRQLQTLSFVQQTEPEGYAKLAAELAQASDLHTSYLVLLQAHRGHRGSEDGPVVLEAARRRHGAVIEDLALVMHEELREEQVDRAREDAKDPEARFFLSLLQNLHEPRVIAALLESRFPGKPGKETMRALVSKLASSKNLGVDLTDEPTRIATLALIDGCTDEEIVGRFANAFGPDEPTRDRGAILRQAALIRRSALAPLFERTNRR